MNIPQATLYLGDAQIVINEVHTLLLSRWCVMRDAQGLSKGCSTCTICRKVLAHQFHLLTWASPTKQWYSLDDIDEVLHRLSFVLNDDEEYFIVIENAEALSTQASNRLLKSLEEPPRGYHFVLLGQAADILLPTIVSRCVITHVTNKGESRPLSQLVEFFKKPEFVSESMFSRIFDEIQPSEYESRKILDELIIYWGHATHDPRSKSMQDLFIRMLAMLPMPGSSKLFWRTIIIRIKYFSHL